MLLYYAGKKLVRDEGRGEELQRAKHRINRVGHSEAGEFPSESSHAMEKIKRQIKVLIIQFLICGSKIHAVMLSNFISESTSLLIFKFPTSIAI